MKNLAVARRYARALLIIGKEDGQAEQYREELKRVTGLLTENPQLEQAITNPQYDSGSRRKVLQTVLEKMSFSRVVTSFLTLLFEKGRFRFLASITEFYDNMADELKGVVRANLVSATGLTSDTVEKIRSTLSEKTGKDIILQVEQDPELIGGIITKIGDLVIDGSIRTQLLNMRETLKRGESV